VTTNGPLTTAQAKAALDCTSHTQLYRWRDAGLIKGTLRRGRVTRWEWDEASVLDLARQIGRRTKGRARRVKLPS
jgi:hypothetical protein